MINIHTFESLLTLFVAYIIVVTLSGYTRAWIAIKMGDYTARYSGALSLNPLDHIDFLGLLLLILFRIGWGKHVTINHHLIDEPYKNLKITIAYLAETIVNLILSFIALILLLKFFGIEIIELVIPMVASFSAISLPTLAEFYPTYSSLTLVFGIILVAITYIGMLLATISFIANAFRLVIIFFFDDTILNDDLFMSLIGTLLFFFLLVPLRIYFILAIAECAQLISPYIS